VGTLEDHDQGIFSFNMKAPGITMKHVTISLERAQIWEFDAPWNDFVLVVWWKLLIWRLC